MTPDTPAVDADAYKAALARLRAQAAAPATDKLRRTALAVQAALADADGQSREGTPGDAERATHAASVERARALVQPPAELPAPVGEPLWHRALRVAGLVGAWGAALR